MKALIDAVQTSTRSRSDSGWLSPAGQVSTQDFLKLLTIQLRYQNPLEPMKETEFVTQLAQFSQLEAEREVSSLAGRLFELQMLGQAASLLGRTVVVRSPDAASEPVRGVVEKVKVVEGEPRLVVRGSEYPLRDVVEIVG